MNVTADALGNVVTTLGALGAVIFDPEGSEVVRVGPLESIQGEGLFSALFGGPAEVLRLRDSLEGQLLPQIWSQGVTNCFVSKLADGTVYGVFSRATLGAADLYRASQQAARAVEALLESK